MTEKNIEKYENIKNFKNRFAFADALQVVFSHQYLGFGDESDLRNHHIPLCLQRTDG
jgi:hypothetical protein